MPKNPLDKLRHAVPASARGTTYAMVGALAPALIAWGILDDVQAAAIVGVIGSVVTLIFAILHSTSTPRSALYGVLAAITVALAVWGYGSPDQWAAILAIIAPVLGVGVAAAKTPHEDVPRQPVPAGV